jgi:hypothetical protein
VTAMTWEVIPVKYGKYAVGEFLTHWAGEPIKPRTVYARASWHRTREAAERAAERINRIYYPPSLEGARRQTDAPDHDEPPTPAPQPPVSAPHAHGGGAAALPPLAFGDA